MKILRLSTLSLALAIAVLTLGYVNPAFAAKPDCELDPGHPSCKDDGDTGTTFTVVVVAGTGNGNWVVTPPDPDCEGQTDSQKLTFFFPETGANCLAGDVMIERMTMAYYLYGIEVREKKTDVMLFFTDMPVRYPIGSDVYNTGRLPATVVEIGESILEIRVDMTGLNLIKAAQPNRGLLVGPIAVGKIVYTANPP